LSSLNKLLSRKKKTSDLIWGRFLLFQRAALSRLLGKSSPRLQAIKDCSAQLSQLSMSLKDFPLR
jgi:hypothetical protein